MLKGTRNLSCFSPWSCSLLQLSPVFSVVTQRPSSPHIHLWQIFSISGLLCSLLAQVWNPCLHPGNASAAIIIKTTSTAFPQLHSSSPSFPPLPFLLYRTPPPLNGTSQLPTLLVASSSLHIDAFTSFFYAIVSITHGRDYSAVSIRHICSNWCHFLFQLLFLVRNIRPEVVLV